MRRRTARGDLSEKEAAMSSPYFIGITLFALSFINDYIYVRYVEYTVRGRAVGAATMSLLYHLVAYVSLTSYLKDRMYFVPYVLGSTVGTWWSVRRTAGIAKESAEIMKVGNGDE